MVTSKNRGTTPSGILRSKYLKQEILYEIIQNELLKRNWSYRAAEKNWGIQKDVFTRLKAGKNIDLVSFLLIVQQLHAVGWSYEKLFREIL